ncbi:MAG: Bax inhibitor-1/YccA family protein [Proteobacteria bacterium]|nr:Bax inhibitor-1/YccA family protein [Pseudomonadota bacterium]MBU1640328.1 Bax inhibitor-1/YccA family protein [Pseudomonadota bacterium]
MFQNQVDRAPYTSTAQTQAVTIFLAKVFNWMAIGLGVTAVVAFMVASSEAAVQFFYVNRIVFYGLIFAELGIVVYLSARIEKLEAKTATGLFLLYSALNGVTLSLVLMLYTATSVATTFLVTAGMFGSMAIYGYVTKKDLSSLGSFMFMGLIGIIIASVVNIFMQSSMMSWVISGIGVIVFTGLTAYDVQRISQMGVTAMSGSEGAMKKMAILGALTLYLDFINLFLMLLRFLGNRD